MHFLIWRLNWDVSSVGQSGDGSSWVTPDSLNKFSHGHVAAGLLYNKYNSRILILKVSEGGTQINLGSNFRGCWNVDYDNIPVGTPKLLQELENRYNALISYLTTNSIDYNVEFCLWHQGESEQGRTSQQYQDDMNPIIAKIREFTGKPNLPFLFGSIPTNSNAYDSNIYAGMQAVEANSANNKLFTWGERNTIDGLHVNSIESINIGEEIAQWVIDNL